jgi:two-component system response regulator GlrR
MSDEIGLPRLLIIDDLFGRTHPNQRNEERANLCGQFLIEDVTGDELGKGASQRIKKPIAQAIFCRGQIPNCATVGDVVENDTAGTLQSIRDGWTNWCPDRPLWSMILLDLCFYTGTVTQESNRKALGMPEGRHGDDHPTQYFGLHLLKEIQTLFPDLPVVILSSKPREQVSRKFSQHGALAFLSRDDERSPELLRDYIRRHGLLPDESGEIVGRSKSLLLTLRAARRAASDRRNILIRGERGTGKELLARYIHRQSLQESQRPFVVVDSGTLSPQLYASELFGHRRGAFTGADRDRTGRILRANGGDLFLDEIGNMPADVQVGLLRVLEYREVTPLGVAEGQPVDVRFLSATNDDLDGKAATGGFRQDLLDRLKVGGVVFLRPLRERVEDIDFLVEHFVREAEQAKPDAMKRRVDLEALEVLRSYWWPGNIRELRSVIYSAVFSYPDVEYLVPVHLHLDEGVSSGRKSHILTKPEHIMSDHNLLINTPDELVATLAGCRFDRAQSVDLLGRLPLLQEVYARLLAQLLKAALQATLKPTLDNPDGEVLIHPAIKLITGDRTITASKAADVIKRILNICPEIEESLMADPLLKEAYETSLRLRPRQMLRKADKSSRPE